MNELFTLKNKLQPIIIQLILTCAVKKQMSCGKWRIFVIVLCTLLIEI